MRARPPSATKKRARYRVAVVGCGKIGALFESEPKREKPASHAGAVLENPKTVLAALVDTNPKNLAGAGKLFPTAMRYASLTTCLKRELPDIVVIATPPLSRAALVRACVKAHVKMIVCEKPLATSLKGARDIERMLTRSRATFVLNYQRRFSPLFRRVREDIRKGGIGRLEQVTCYYSNGLFNNGGHIVDALLYLLNDEITFARAIRNKTNANHPAGDMNIDGLLTTKGGATIALQSFDQRAYAIHDMRLMGTTGAITLTDFGQHGIWRLARPSRFAGLKNLSISRAKEQRESLSATRGALAHVIRCFEHRQPPQSGVKNGVAVLRVLEALKKSAKAGGKRIRIQ